MSAAAPRTDIHFSSTISRVAAGTCVMCLLEMVEITCSELDGPPGHLDIIGLECPECASRDHGYDCAACLDGPGDNP